MQVIEKLGGQGSIWALESCDYDNDINEILNCIPSIHYIPIDMFIANIQLDKTKTTIPISCLWYDTSEMAFIFFELFNDYSSIACDKIEI